MKKFKNNRRHEYRSKSSGYKDDCTITLRHALSF